MTATKQAVRELREILADATRDELGEPLRGRARIECVVVAVDSLNAVLDRLEELENGWPSPRKVAELIAENADLRAERDAINAKFAEANRRQTKLLECLEDWQNQEATLRDGIPEIAGKLADIRSRFPALDSSGDETEDGREG